MQESFETASDNRFSALSETAFEAHALESAVRYSSDGIVIGVSKLPGPQSVIVYVNDAFLGIVGRAREAVVGRSPLTLLPRGNDLAAFARLEAEAMAGRSSSVEVEYLRDDGSTRYVDVSVALADRAESGPRRWVAVARDNTERRMLEITRGERSRLLEAIARGAPLEAVLERITAFVERAVPSSIALLMVKRDGELHRAANGPRLSEAFFAALGRVAIAETSGPCGCAAFRKKPVLSDDLERDWAPGRFRDIAARNGLAACWSFPIVSTGGETLGTVCAYAERAGPPGERTFNILEEASNVAAIAIERSADLMKLRDLSLRDPVTNLPNRDVFEDRLRRAIANAKRSTRRLALAMFDLDRFKIVNDSLGHRAGDTLMREVAYRFERAVAKNDVLARLSGDEFVLLMTGIASAAEAESRTRALGDVLRPPFFAGDREIFVRATFGIALYPQDALSAEALMQRADRAMYAAKLRGPDLAFYDASEDSSGKDRLGLESALTRALDNGEFRIAYQKQVDLSTRELRGVEALLRWDSPSRGFMKPADFIHIAEETGLIVPIGAWVLRDACRRNREFAAAGSDVTVAVNVSARQFEDTGFVSTVRDALLEFDVPQGRLHLELTESMLVRSPLVAASMLRELKALGVKIVMDDFGTGYSSLTHLKQFPVDVLKIDRSFVRDLGKPSEDANDRAIVSAIVAIADELGLTTVSEGIETEAQLRFLQRHGCTIGQGYLFGDFDDPAPARSLPG